MGLAKRDGANRETALRNYLLRLDRRAACLLKGQHDAPVALGRRTLMMHSASLHALCGKCGSGRGSSLSSTQPLTSQTDLPLIFIYRLYAPLLQTETDSLSDALIRNSSNEVEEGWPTGRKRLLRGSSEAKCTPFVLHSGASAGRKCSALAPARRPRGIVSCVLGARAPVGYQVQEPAHTHGRAGWRS